MLSVSSRASISLSRVKLGTGRTHLLYRVCAHHVIAAVLVLSLVV